MQNEPKWSTDCAKRTQFAAHEQERPSPRLEALTVPPVTGGNRAKQSQFPGGTGWDGACGTEGTGCCTNEANSTAQPIVRNKANFRRAGPEPIVRNEPNFASRDGAGGARGGLADRTCKTNPISAQRTMAEGRQGRPGYRWDQSRETKPIGGGPGKDQGPCGIKEKEVRRGRPTHGEPTGNRAKRSQFPSGGPTVRLSWLASARGFPIFPVGYRTRLSAPA